MSGLHGDPRVPDPPADFAEHLMPWMRADAIAYWRLGYAAALDRAPVSHDLIPAANQGGLT